MNFTHTHTGWSWWKCKRKYTRRLQGTHTHTHKGAHSLMSIHQTLRLLHSIEHILDGIAPFHESDEINKNMQKVSQWMKEHQDPTPVQQQNGIDKVLREYYKREDDIDEAFDILKASLQTIWTHLAQLQDVTQDYYTKAGEQAEASKWAARISNKSLTQRRKTGRSARHVVAVEADAVPHHNEFDRTFAMHPAMHVNNPAKLKQRVAALKSKLARRSQPNQHVQDRVNAELAALEGLLAIKHNYSAAF